MELKILTVCIFTTILIRERKRKKNVKYAQISLVLYFSAKNDQKALKSVPVTPKTHSN